MKNWKPAVCLVGAATAAVLVAGCSGDGEAASEHTAASSKAAEPPIDLKVLNTGKYPTSPRPPFPRSTPANILQVEGQRMAEYIVVPFEIDQDLTNAKLPTMVITGKNNMKAVMAPEPVDVPANDAVVGGYVATAGTPDSSLRAGNQRSINNMVVRYLTPADAGKAADQMAAASAKAENATTTKIDGLPDTTVIKKDDGDKQTIMAYTPHNTYVLYQWYQTTTKQQDLLEPTIKKAVTLQGKLIDQFPATPTKAEAKAKGIEAKDPMIDQNKVLIYALPYSDEELKKSTGMPSGSMRAVYGPRGMAMTSSDPVTDFNVLSEVGSTANGVERSTVYRARDDAGAKKIVDTFVAANRTQGMGNVAGPQGLPIAKCQSKAVNESTMFICLVQKGRYVGSVTSNNKADAYQQISAQYTILTKADQNAK